MAAADTEGPRHAALFYRTRDELTAGVLDFLRQALIVGAPMLLAGTGANLRFLHDYTGRLAEDITWEELPEEGINPRRITAAVRLFTDEHPGQPVRVVQELGWPARSPETVRETVRHEALLNLMLAEAPARVLCAYHTHLPGGVLADAERTHPMLIRDGRGRASTRYVAGGPVLPAEWDEPLPPPPAAAVRLGYTDSLAAVRRLAAAEAQRAGLAKERAADLVMAVSELAANTLAHTTGPGAVTIWVEHGEIVGQVDDSGMISDPLAGIHCPDPTEVPRGHGLWVVHQLCDLVETRTGPSGTSTRVHMRLPR